MLVVIESQVLTRGQEPHLEDTAVPARPEAVKNIEPGCKLLIMTRTAPQAFPFNSPHAFKPQRFKSLEIIGLLCGHTQSLRLEMNHKGSALYEDQTTT